MMARITSFSIEKLDLMSLSWIKRMPPVNIFLSFAKCKVFLARLDLPIPLRPKRVTIRSFSYRSDSRSIDISFSRNRSVSILAGICLIMLCSDMQRHLP